MNLDIRYHKNCLVITFKRKCNLNTTNTEEFKSLLLSGYESGKTVILDLTNLDFVDSAGLTVLIYIRKKILETGGRLIFVNIGDRLQKLLQITRLHRVFEVYDSLHSALKVITQKSDLSPQPDPNTIHLQVKHTETFSLIKFKKPDSLTKANSLQFRQKMIEYLEQKNIIILNFDAVRNIDSTGIASLIHLKKYTKEQHKKIILVYDNRVLNRLFKLYSLDDIFPQFQTNEEAIATIKPSSKIKQQKEKAKSEQKPSVNVYPEFIDIHYLVSVKQT